MNGLLPLADDAIAQRENEIFDRKCRVYASIILKLFPMTGIAPVIGYILDQRTLGIVLGIDASVVMLGSTGVVAGILAVNNQQALAAVTALAGLCATAFVVYKCVQLEQWAWEKERRSAEKLETAHQDAVTIRARLHALIAKKGKSESKDQ